MEIEQPVVMVQEVEVVTIPLQRITEVLIVRNVVISNSTAFSNATAFGNVTAISNSAAFSNATAFGNMTAINNGTAQARNGSLPATLNSAAYWPLHTPSSRVMQASSVRF